MLLRNLAFSLFPLAFSLGITSAIAQGYPAKPVRIIAGFTGGSELMARMVALQLTPALGQQVYVEPRLGAAGNIGFEAAARSAPDGYTLLMGAVPLLTNPFVYRKVGYDPMRDFVPIAMVATIPNGLVVLPARSPMVRGASARRTISSLSCCRGPPGSSLRISRTRARASGSSAP